MPIHMCHPEWSVSEIERVYPLLNIDRYIRLRNLMIASLSMTHQCLLKGKVGATHQGVYVFHENIRQKPQSSRKQEIFVFKQSKQVHHCIRCYMAVLFTKLKSRRIALCGYSARFVSKAESKRKGWCSLGPPQNYISGFVGIGRTMRKPL